MEENIIVKTKKRKKGFQIKRIFFLIFLVLFLAIGLFILLEKTGKAHYFLDLFNKELKTENHEDSFSDLHYSAIAYEEAIIKVVESVSPAVVNIIISKEVPVIEDYYYDDFEDFFGFRIRVPREKWGIEKKEVGEGSGVIVSPDGLILTNRHVVNDEEAEYSVITIDGKKYKAEVLTKDPVQDLAVLKIKNGEKLKTAKMGDSSEIRIGQTAIAIGNALGEFRNTVSVGVVSGLGRTIPATDGRTVQVLEDIIQTDAAINPGNSGGPLLNLKGEIIGINVAMALDAQNIGFSVPINRAKSIINDINSLGRASYPFLGVRYIMINEKIKEENNLSLSYGAWVIGEEGSPAITPGSPAESAGIKEGDIILAFDGKKIDEKNSLGKVISEYRTGDRVFVKVNRNDKEITIEVILGERE